MFSLGRIRRAVQPLVLRYWLSQRTGRTVTTRLEGFTLAVFPSVFHPRYFGSSAILARFVSSLDLRDKLFLEVGCGSGIVAMCAARAGARVTAVDINPEAVRCTLENARTNGLTIDALAGDLFSSVDARRFGVIAWNPPYLPRDPANVSERAFYGGPQFDLIRRFASEARSHLTADGAIYSLLSADIDVPAIEAIFRAHHFSVRRAFSTRWGLGETMLILCAR